MKNLYRFLTSVVSMNIVSCLIIGTFGSGIAIADETSETPSIGSHELTTEAKNLFYGYNITGGKALMEADAIPKVHPIIDLNSDYPIEWNDFSGEQENCNYASSNFRELEREFSASVVSGTEAEIYFLSANLDVAFNTDKKVSNVYSEYYEMYSCRIEKGSYVVHNLEASDIRQYLAPKFVEDINSIRSVADADAFFNKYGTHLSTGYKYGGLMNITNYKTTSDSSVQLSQGTSLETKISGAISNANAGKSISLSEIYESNETTSETTSTYNFKSYGGEAVAGVNIDSLFTYNPSLTGNGKYEYGRWVDSINDGKKLAVIGVANGCGLIPLWDLLDPSANPDIRSYMINSYIELCGDKYEEYTNKYPTMNRSIDAQRSSENSSAPVLDGTFIKTKNQYLYYVDINDLISTNGSHSEVHEGDVLYLCISNPSVDNYDFICSACEMVDKRSGIFKVTGKKNDKVTIKYKDDSGETSLLSVPIEKCSFEGGAGTKKYPYLVSNANQFKKMNNAPKDTHYQLINDIDFGGETIHPLGTLNGTVDGNYCCISNFKIEETDRWGLFNEIGDTGELKNIKISNAGTCLTPNQYSKSKLYLGEETPAKTCAVTASQAGIICGRNNGKIKDCCVIDCYLCNVDVSQTKLKNDPDRNGQKKAEMSSGLIVGENQGSISGCMVKNSSVLGAYVNNGDNNKDNIFVYTGGVVGKATSGSLEGCVLVNDNSHYVCSITGNNNKLNAFAANNEVRTYAAGLIGYCEKNSSVTLESVYIQVSAENTIDSTTYKYGTLKTNPDSYHHLKSIAVIAADKTLKLGNCYSYCESKNKMHCYLIPNDKRADSIDNTGAYDTNDEEFDENGNSKIDDNSNFYDSTYSISGSIMHILEQKREDHISLSFEESDNNMKSVYCSGDRLTVNGLKLKETVRDEEDYNGLVVFNVRITENGLIKSIDTPLTTLGSEVYHVEVSMYNRTVLCNDKIALEVNENAISEFVVENNSDKTIYLDKANDYITSWTQDDMSVTAVLSNGTRISETDPEFASFVDKSKFELVTTADDIAKGDNYIKVKYLLNKNEIYASYIVPVIEREITGIKIQETPDKLEYKSGDRVDISGIKVLVNYDQGPSDVCSSKDKLPVTGDVIAEGENVVVVTYDGHLNCTDSFTVVGTPDPVTEEPITGKDNGIGKTIIIVIVVVVVVIGIVIAFVLLKGKRNSKDVDDTKESERPTDQNQTADDNNPSSSSSESESGAIPETVERNQE